MVTAEFRQARQQSAWSDRVFSTPGTAAKVCPAARIRTLAAVVQSKLPAIWARVEQWLVSRAQLYALSLSLLPNNQVEDYEHRRDAVTVWLR